MYFWLNYCNENHIERIPIAVKNINHLFHQASEMMDRLHLLLIGFICFYFLTVLESMIMNA